MAHDFSTEDTINFVLSDLIYKKSQRDGVRFTSSKLASALDLPRSSITRLMHPDKKKRITNPAIGTLVKIVEFFKADGINISIEDFVGINKKVVDVQEQQIGLLKHSITIPVYTLNGVLYENIPEITISVDDNNKNFLAFIIKEDMKPIFKQGSVFIINTDISPEDENLIGIKLNQESPVVIRKYNKKNNKITVSFFEKKTTEIDLSTLINYNIVGVVVQVVISKK